MADPSIPLTITEWEVRSTLVFPISKTDEVKRTWHRLFNLICVRWRQMTWIFERRIPKNLVYRFDPKTTFPARCAKHGQGTHAWFMRVRLPPSGLWCKTIRNCRPVSSALFVIYTTRTRCDLWVSRTLPWLQGIEQRSVRICSCYSTSRVFPSLLRSGETPTSPSTTTTCCPTRRTTTFGSSPTRLCS